MYQTAELQRPIGGEDFIPCLQDEIVMGSQGDTALQKFSAFASRRIDFEPKYLFEKNRRDILLVTPLETKPQIILLEGPAAA